MTTLTSSPLYSSPTSYHVQIDGKAYASDVLDYYTKNCPVKKAEVLFCHVRSILQNIKDLSFVEYVCFHYFQTIESLSLLYTFVLDRFDNVKDTMIESDVCFPFPSFLLCSGYGQSQ